MGQALWECRSLGLLKGTGNLGSRAQACRPHRAPAEAGTLKEPPHPTPPPQRPRKLAEGEPSQLVLPYPRRPETGSSSGGQSPAYRKCGSGPGGEKNTTHVTEKGVIKD